MAAFGIVVGGALVGSALLGPPGGTGHPAGSATAEVPAGESVAGGPIAGGPAAAGRGQGLADVDGDGHLDGLTWDRGVITSGRARWALGSDGDAILISDWDCDGLATPALVRAADGLVFVFAQWPARSETLTAEPLGAVPEHADLVAPAACGPPLARADDDPPTSLAPVPHPDPVADPEPVPESDPLPDPEPESDPVPDPEESTP